MSDLGGALADTSGRNLVTSSIPPPDGNDVARDQMRGGMQWWDGDGDNGSPFVVEVSLEVIKSSPVHWRRLLCACFNLKPSSAPFGIRIQGKLIADKDDSVLAAWAQEGDCVSPVVACQVAAGWRVTESDAFLSPDRVILSYTIDETETIYRGYSLPSGHIMGDGGRPRSRIARDREAINSVSPSMRDWRETVARLTWLDWAADAVAPVRGEELAWGTSLPSEDGVAEFKTCFTTDAVLDNICPVLNGIGRPDGRAVFHLGVHDHGGAVGLKLQVLDVSAVVKAINTAFKTKIFPPIGNRARCRLVQTPLSPRHADEPNGEVVALVFDNFTDLVFHVKSWYDAGKWHEHAGGESILQDLIVADAADDDGDTRVWAVFWGGGLDRLPFLTPAQQNGCLADGGRLPFTNPSCFVDGSFDHLDWTADGVRIKPRPAFILTLVVDHLDPARPGTNLCEKTQRPPFWI